MRPLHRNAKESLKKRYRGKWTGHVPSFPWNVEGHPSSCCLAGVQSTPLSEHFADCKTCFVNSSPTSPDMNQRHASSTSTVPSSSFQPPSTPVRQSRSSGDKLQRFSSGTTTLDTKGRASVSDGDFGEDEWDMLTPPPSDPPRSQAEGHHHGRSVFADGGSSPSPLPRTTGKRPSTMSSSQTLLKWEDPLPSSSNLDEPYEHSNVSKKLDFSQPAHFTSQFLSDELDASMSEAFAYEQLAQCAHIFDPRLQHVLKDLPHRLEEFKKSERKRIAAEKSAEAKARRIAALEREVDEYVPDLLSNGSIPFQMLRNPT
ncbi:hypothetical protein CC2G_009343 [Coprinopsis cinerea AmutBmut pab1-1]|nr:hypothetical protein CC2G_009343 [Coprinopsis cinerea AmutBmut pab1-1]